MISMYQLMITIGIVLAFASDTWLASYATIGGVTGGHWRVMLGVIAIPAAVMFLGVLFLPESPRWALPERPPKARGGCFRGMHLDEAEIAAEIQAIEDSLKVKQGGLELLLQNANFRRAVALGVGLQINPTAQPGINVIMYYAPRIFQIAGFDTTIEQMWGTVIVGITNVLGHVHRHRVRGQARAQADHVCRFCDDGRGMVTVGVLFNIGVEHDPSLGYPAIIALLIFIIGFAMSAGPIIWVLCSEIYPLSGRDSE